MAVEGRGWHWPDSAQVRSEKQSLRVPMLRILKAVIDGQPVEVAGEAHQPIELLAAAPRLAAREASA